MSNHNANAKLDKVILRLAAIEVEKSRNAGNTLSKREKVVFKEYVMSELTDVTTSLNYVDPFVNSDRDDAKLDLLLIKLIRLRAVRIGVDMKYSLRDVRRTHEALSHFEHLLSKGEVAYD